MRRTKPNILQIRFIVITLSEQIKPVFIYKQKQQRKNDNQTTHELIQVMKIFSRCPQTR